MAAPRYDQHELETKLELAAEAIGQARAVVVLAGAGMGVDSGLPDFRGTEGLWRAYPPLAKLGLDFAAMANPRWFRSDPALAWGFYGHRLNLYRQVRPHRGYDLLRSWSADVFSFTSNVDGHFLRAGYAREALMECHGSLLHLQCTQPCCDEIWEADELVVAVDEETLRAADPLPACPSCGALARPNVLMFGDGGWVEARTAAQQRRFRQWLEDHAVDGHDPLAGVVAVECGAGTAVPTVRWTSEDLVRLGATLIRINPREPEVPPRQLSLPIPALAALEAINERLNPRCLSAICQRRRGRLCFVGSLAQCELAVF